MSNADTRIQWWLHKVVRLNAAVCTLVFAMLYVYVVTEPIYSFNTEYVM